MCMTFALRKTGDSRVGISNHANAQREKDKSFCFVRVILYRPTARLPYHVMYQSCPQLSRDSRNPVRDVIKRAVGGRGVNAC